MFFLEIDRRGNNCEYFQYCRFGDTDQEDVIIPDCVIEEQIRESLSEIGGEGTVVVEEHVELFDMTRDSEYLMNEVIEDFPFDRREWNIEEESVSSDEEGLSLTDTSISEIISVCSTQLKYFQQNNLVEHESQLLQISGTLRIRRVVFQKQTSIRNFFG